MFVFHIFEFDHKPKMKENKNIIERKGKNKNRNERKEIIYKRKGETYFVGCWSKIDLWPNYSRNEIYVQRIFERSEKGISTDKNGLKALFITSFNSFGVAMHGWIDSITSLAVMIFVHW